MVIYMLICLNESPTCQPAELPLTSPVSDNMFDSNAMFFYCVGGGFIYFFFLYLFYTLISVFLRIKDLLLFESTYLHYNAILSLHRGGIKQCQWQMYCYRDIFWDDISSNKCFVFFNTPGLMSACNNLGWRQVAALQTMILHVCLFFYGLRKFLRLAMWREISFVWDGAPVKSSGAQNVPHSCSKWTESGALQRESSFFIFLCFVFVDFRLRTYPSFVFVFVFLDCGCVCIQHFLDLQTVSLQGHSSLTRLDLPLFSLAAEISDVQRFLFSFFSSFFFFRQQNNQKMWSSPLPVISQTKRSLIWGRVCLMQS